MSIPKAIIINGSLFLKLHPVGDNYVHVTINFYYMGEGGLKHMRDSENYLIVTNLAPYPVWRLKEIIQSCWQPLTYCDKYCHCLAHKPNKMKLSKLLCICKNAMDKQTNWHTWNLYKIPRNSGHFTPLFIAFLEGFVMIFEVHELHKWTNLYLTGVFSHK